MATVRTLIHQFTSPVVLILIAATVLSMAVGDLTDGYIILAIILASGFLGFYQDFRASRDVAALMARVQTLVDIVRDGKPLRIPTDQVIVDDVISLKAGSVIPADCHVVEATNLSVDQSALTGESFPADKVAGTDDPSLPLAKRDSAVMLGTHVVSGTGTVKAYAVGADTEFGAVRTSLTQRAKPTAYERGLTRFGYLLVRLMLIVTVFVFVVNILFHRPLMDAWLFSLALAVGITPQMLPAIVTISLSAGARLLAQHKVIVKRLEAIEDFGAMTILCTDKTGTITEGAPALDKTLDLSGADSPMVLRLASLNAGLQSGYANQMDQAILAKAPAPADIHALSEVPYDFNRKRLSILTDVDGTRTLITKGAYSNVLGVCSDVADRAAVDAQFAKLSADGYRVLALATKTLPNATTASVDDEGGMTLVGLIGFHDPVKPSAADAIKGLAAVGVEVRIITGDNELVAKAVGASVGLQIDTILTGPDVDKLTDMALVAATKDVQIFAEVEPQHKQRIVKAMQSTGVGVGYLGDGINDAPALHSADVGISVDDAVDVARDAAASVLLDKDLGVVLDGVRTGRQTFANTLKYARLTTSANFGNMISMAAASLFLPFLPLLPRQILLLNFLTDFPSTAIASDSVDAEAVAQPARWDLRQLLDFMVIFGALSTVFDLATFAVLRAGLHASQQEFHAAWFIESSLTELLVVFSLRTTKPMFRSMPSKLLMALSLGTAVVIVAIPHVPPIAKPLGFTGLSWGLIAAVVALTVAYVAANEAVKPWFYARAGRQTFSLPPGARRDVGLRPHIAK